VAAGALQARVYGLAGILAIGMGRLLAAILCVVSVGVATAAAAPTGTRPKPILALEGSSPLTVRGAHFKRLEHVRVTLSSPGSSVVRRIRATARGTFRVNFGEVDVVVDKCSGGYSLTAVGSEGSRAALSPQALKAPQPDCPPPP
jgi:hypothetical protein